MIDQFACEGCGVVTQYSYTYRLAITERCRNVIAMSIQLRMCQQCNTQLLKNDGNPTVNEFQLWKIS